MIEITLHLCVICSHISRERDRTLFLPSECSAAERLLQLRISNKMTFLFGYACMRNLKLFQSKDLGITNHVFLIIRTVPQENFEPEAGKATSKYSS